jgi:hypothetical protein
MHVCALEVIGEDLSEDLLAIDDVSWQMIQPSPRGISQLDREELDDEGFIIRSAHSAREAVILQLDVGVGFAVVLDEVA